MILVILYAIGAVYFTLMALGLVQRAWWARIDAYTRSSVRLAISILALGCFGLAVYNLHLYSEFREKRLPGQTELQPQSPQPVPVEADE